MLFERLENKTHRIQYTSQELEVNSIVHYQVDITRYLMQSHYAPTIAMVSNT